MEMPDDWDMEQARTYKTKRDELRRAISQLDPGGYPAEVLRREARRLDDEALELEQGKLFTARAGGGGGLF